MDTEINCESASPTEFATIVGRWFELLERRGEPTPAMREARAASCVAIKQAAALGRQELFDALAEHEGAAAMKLAAQEGIVGAIERLHAAGVDCDAQKKSSSVTPLMVAAKHGHTEAVRTLLDRGADRARQEAGFTALSLAVMEGHFETARAILDRTENVDELVHWNGTMLHCVAEYGGAELVPAIVKCGVSPDTPDKSKKPPLAVAAEAGRADVVRALLDAGAPTELPPPAERKSKNPFLVENRDSPLLLAAKHGHEEVVGLLLEAGADTQAKDNQKMTAYDWARKNQHVRVASLLRDALGLKEDEFDGHDLIAAARAADLAKLERAIAGGVEIDFCDVESADAEGNSIPGRTALMWATVEGQTDAARALLAAGASPDKKHKKAFDSGDTVWELAARFGRTEILTLLQQQSTETDPKNLAEALATAAQHGHVDVVTQLLDSGVDANVRVSYRRTALMSAATAGQAEAIRLLIERGATVDLRSSGEFASTALHDAVGGLTTGRYVEDAEGNQVVERFGDPVACVRALLDAGADPNSVRKDGGVPLNPAVGSPEVVRMLIEAGADANAAKCDGWTPLHWAVAQRTPESVRILLDAGAFVSPVNDRGQTPLDIARERDMPEIAAMLEEAGGVPGMETEEGRAAVDAEYAQELEAQKRHEEMAAADEALRPNFAEAVKTKGYQQAIERLETLTSIKPESPENLPALTHVRVPRDDAERLTVDERRNFNELGCTLFRCGYRVLMGDDDLLGVLPTTDPFEVIAAIGTAGPNYDVYMSEIVAELKELHEVAPFHLTEVRHDTIGLEFTKTVPKPKVRKWAFRLYELCPDLVDQGFMHLNKLRDHLTKHKRLTLWWD